MGWANQYIAKLKSGHTVEFRPRGISMTGRINSGNLCTVEPFATQPLAVGMIVLCKVSGAQYLHLVTALEAGRVQIGNNKNHINGWTKKSNIYGICTKVQL